MRIKKFKVEEDIRRIINELERIQLKTLSGFSKVSIREDRDNN
jgi:hypothetical protein